MPPVFALFLALAFCGVLLWRDARAHRVAAATWLPVVWIFTAGSRFLSQWLEMVGVPVGQASYEDGSTLDAVFFVALIAGGALVLAGRRVAVTRVARHNVWIALFLVYCLLAVTWSDFPFVAFKRWIKILGHPIMALIILTDRAPQEALRSVLKRSAFLMVPLSVVFIKYYPEFGRAFDVWTGAAVNRGIALSKNELGHSSMLLALFFGWNLLTVRQRLQGFLQRSEEAAISLLFLGLIAWLLVRADSATAIAALFVGLVTLATVRSPLVRGRFLGTYVVAIVLAAVLAETSFGVYAAVVELLGRDPTLTDRTLVWQDLLAVDINPVIGAGFESFWLGPRLEMLWAKWWWKPNQAHNGYLETYLNLGWLGVLLLGALLVATFRKGRYELLHNAEFGAFRLAILFAIVAYNYAEASFKGVSLVWAVFYFIAMDYPAAASGSRESVPAGAATKHDEWHPPAPAAIGRPESPWALSRARASGTPADGTRPRAWR